MNSASALFVDGDAGHDAESSPVNLDEDTSPGAKSDALRGRVSTASSITSSHRLRRDSFNQGQVVIDLTAARRNTRAVSLSPQPVTGAGAISSSSDDFSDEERLKSGGGALSKSRVSATQSCGPIRRGRVGRRSRHASPDGIRKNSLAGALRLSGVRSAHVRSPRAACSHSPRFARAHTVVGVGSESQGPEQMASKEKESQSDCENGTEVDMAPRHKGKSDTPSNPQLDMSFKSADATPSACSSINEEANRGSEETKDVSQGASLQPTEVCASQIAQSSASSQPLRESCFSFSEDDVPRSVRKHEQVAIGAGPTPPSTPPAAKASRQAIGGAGPLPKDRKSVV